jgi:hypothetical protein
LDGILIGHDTLTANDGSRPTTLINVVCEYNARQGFTWDSGIGLTVINSKFNFQGKGRFASSPASGVDIETGGTQVCRNGVFINCEFLHNLTNGMVADSGDSADIKFSKCTFWGSTGGAIWPNKPRMVFEDCKIFGGITACYDAQNDLDAVKFIRCEIEDKVHPIYGGTKTESDYIINVTSLVHFQKTSIVANNCRSFYLSKAVLEDCSVTHKASLANNSAQCLLGNSKLIRVKFLENIADSNNYYISKGAVTTEKVSNSGPRIGWGSTIPNGGGTGSLYDGNDDYNNHADITTNLFRAIGLSQYHQDPNTANSRLLFSQPSAPTTGTWKLGDCCLNSSPTVGSPKGWSCTAGGTPGTWTPESQVGYRTNAGTPVSVLTPNFIGEWILDTTNKVIYDAVGTTSADWKPRS